MDKDTNNKLAIQLTKKWEIDISEAISSENLQLLLAQRIQEMLKNELEALLLIMYRMDIAENDFQAAMQLGNLQAIANKIAILVIEREMQKIYTRKLFQ